MARATYASFNQNGNFVARLGEMVRALAVLASGKNPDGSNYNTPHAAITATTVATGTGDSQVAAAATGLRLLGYSVRESAGSAAVAAFNLRNGTTDAAALLAMGELAADSEKTVWFGPNGIDAASGIFLDRVAGETTIVVYHTTIT